MRKLDLVPLFTFLKTTVFEKNLRFSKLTHDLKNMPKVKFQNQCSFRICYHSLRETFITSNLLFKITTFVNRKVRQLMDLTERLSAPENIEKNQCEMLK